ncbi:DNA-3-methyladenine glycosylase family protein [Sphaerimonospora thailandensis]|uniref:DNA-3-methyladenine glycosylase II n=1 Tax=Sphaerimonospora thailandensis TaxID=795644 RepID=A0A8J3W1N6_9ACTN|nr:DNA-3-methyladenine glycosylase 2 family protein [Sphaerimonospora thailandensis]GIH72288.1 3-methyladenine DNA glycosylase [Sphaerimonospora thailandensis]
MSDLMPAPGSAPGPGVPKPVAPPRPSERAWRPDVPIDVALTLAPHRRGGSDPAWRRTPDGAVWRTARTPDGPATLRIVTIERAGEVRAQAWGPGAEWSLERLPGLLGADDDVAGFADLLAALARSARAGETEQARRAMFVARLAARHPGLRIGRSLRVFEALVPAVLEQKVVGREAWRAWRWLVRRYGEAAPGPAPEGMTVIPPPEVWRQIPSWDWHRAGAEAVRARTVVNAARHAEKLEATCGGAGSAEADRLLRALPGIGVWTSAEVRQRAHGDPDAPSVGDYHLPSIVGWALTGQKTDDAGMLALLEPFRGHRHRVIKLIELSGIRPPARGPRMPARDYRSF